MTSTETQAALEAASREPCPECGGEKVKFVLVGLAVGYEAPCTACAVPDATGQLVASGRRWPELGKVCPCTAFTPYAGVMQFFHRENPDAPDCQGTGVVPNLSREACDATAQRCGYKFQTCCCRVDPEGVTLDYRYRYYIGEGVDEYESRSAETPEAAAQAALAAVLAAQDGR